MTPRAQVPPPPPKPYTPPCIFVKVIPCAPSPSSTKAMPARSSAARIAPRVDAIGVRRPPSKSFTVETPVFASSANRDCDQFSHPRAARDCAGVIPYGYHHRKSGARSSIWVDAIHISHNELGQPKRMASLTVQHFLKSRAARSLSIAQVARLGGEEAFECFRMVRWASTQGEAVCPRCGCCATYTLAKRKLWDCKACRYQFSVTAGTIFASRKLPIRTLLPRHGACSSTAQRAIAPCK